MELKVKQVCPDTVTSVTCWEQVENDSCDLVRSGTKAPILSRLNSTSRNLATTLTAIGGSILGRDCTENVLFETFGFLKLANIFSITRKSCKIEIYLLIVWRYNYALKKIPTTLAAYSTVRELRVHHDLWRHQKDIPWAHTGGVWERKRWRNSANRLVEKTGQ